MSVDEPAVPGVDGLADWGDAEPLRLILVKRTDFFGGLDIGGLDIGARYEVKGKPGIDVDELRVLAFRMLTRSFPDENPMDWKVGGEWV